MAKSNKSEKPLPTTTQIPMYPFKYGLNIWCMPNEDFRKDGSYAFTDDDIEVLEKTVGFPLSSKSLSVLQHLLAKKSELFKSKSVEEWNWPNIITMLESLEIEKEITQKKQKQLQTRHSPDFRSVNWFETSHSFTPTQAAIVKILWEAWENKTPDVGHSNLLATAGSESNRLVDVFKGHKTYKKLIGKGKTKGSFRLIEPVKSGK
jgi:hypothetical protein